MAPHSSTLAWKLPWAEEPGGLQSMGLLRVGHDWSTSLSLFTFMHWRRKWQPTPVFLPGESQGQGSLVGCLLWGRTESDTTEVKCSNSSSNVILWASLVAQLVKNLPAMQETLAWFLGQEDPLEKGMATHSSILAWRIPWTEEPGRPHSPWRLKELDMTEWLSTAHEAQSYLIVSSSCFPSYLLWQIIAQSTPP